jgi:hypothetical protein
MLKVRQYLSTTFHASASSALLVPGWGLGLPASANARHTYHGLRALALMTDVTHPQQQLCEERGTSSHSSGILALTLVRGCLALSRVHAAHDANGGS